MLKKWTYNKKKNTTYEWLMFWRGMCLQNNLKGSQLIGWEGIQSGSGMSELMIVTNSLLGFQA
jgi:hypothetical protein